MHTFYHNTSTFLFTFLGRRLQCTQTLSDEDLFFRTHNAFFLRYLAFWKEKKEMDHVWYIEKDQDVFVARSTSKTTQLASKEKTCTAFTQACNEVSLLYNDIQGIIGSYIDETLPLTCFSPEMIFCMVLSRSLQYDDCIRLLKWVVHYSFFYNCKQVKEIVHLTNESKYENKNVVITLNSNNELSCCKWDKYLQTIPIKEFSKEYLLNLYVKDISQHYLYDKKESKEQKLARRQWFFDTIQHQLQDMF